jgi:sigma-B regulation protein RsbU (phosphoserine phosphatase)
MSAAIVDKATVLAVDDTPENLDVVKGVLSPEYAVKVAINGATALKIARSQAPDLILLDIMMPGMDGYEVCRRLKEEPTTRDIPVIFLTAKDQTMDEARGFDLGGADYIHKPVNPPILEARVRTHVALSRSIEALRTAYERQNADLEKAADYVSRLLPDPWTTGDVLTEWRFIPCDQLGGDSFGFHRLDDDRFAIYLVDVSGHGTAPALHSVSVINLLRKQSLPGVDFARPAEVAAALNTTFQMTEHRNLYFTFWYGVFDRSRRSLSYLSAGHPPALLLRGEGAERLITPNLPVGMMPGSEFSEAVVSVPAGSRLFLYSDGAYEVETRDGSEWQVDPFLDLLSRAPNAPGAPRWVEEQVRQVMAAAEFEDDFSVLVASFPQAPEGGVRGD